MKYKPLRMVAILFMTSFNRDRGEDGPLAPPPTASAAEGSGKYTMACARRDCPTGLFPLFTGPESSHLTL